MTSAAAKSQVRYVVNGRCTRACSLNPENLAFADEALAWFAARRSIEWMVGESEKLGRKLSPAAISRHRSGHLDRELEEAKAEVDDSRPVDNLKVLQAMIKAGYKRSGSWRIGPSETLKAMELYYRLTQGSAMESLFNALTAAAAGEETEGDGTFDAGSLSAAELEASTVDVDTD